MSPSAQKTLVFGSVSGALWSFAPGLLSGLFYKDGQYDARSTGLCITVFVAGILTGIAVSFTLRPLLKTRGRWMPVLLGLCSLPLGAFIFGVIISVVHLLVKSVSGTTYTFVEYGFRPISAGADYALYSAISIFALVLYPLSITTTFRLRRIVHNQSTDPTA